MFKFMLGHKNIDGTIIEKRLKDVISTGKNFIYKPRAAGHGGFHKHADKMDEIRKKKMLDRLEYFLHFFGYAKDERDPKDINAS